MRFWLQQGVRGFYLTNLQHLQFNVENPEHVLQLLHEIRALLANPPKLFNARSPSSSAHPILITDSHALDQLAKRMRSPLLDKAYQRAQFGQINPTTNQSHTDLHRLFDLLETWLQLRSQQSELVRDQVNELFLNGNNQGVDGSRRRLGQVLWSVGGHQTVRLATRFSLAHTGLAQFLQAMLPGAINIFYGDEFGQKEPINSITGQVSCCSALNQSIKIDLLIKTLFRITTATALITTFTNGLECPWILWQLYTLRSTTIITTSR